MDNLEFYNKFRAVPPNAQKAIQAGRLKGKTDINPMWRIETLTANFGACGIGWYYTVDKQWLEESKNETAAFCNISLYVNINGEWSKPIPGTGGSMFVANERNGLYTDDDCYKKALTDAISVACKALGIGADVYWSAGASTSKYMTDTMPPEPPPVNIVKCPKCGKEVKPVKGGDGRIRNPEEVLKGCGGMCAECYKAAKNAGA